MEIIATLLVLGVVVYLCVWIIGMLNLPEPVRVALVVLLVLALIYNHGYYWPALKL